MKKHDECEIDAVILDWAGTAVDYGCFAPVQAFLEVFKSARLSPTMEEIRRPMGMLKWDHIHAVLSMPGIAAQFAALHGRAFTDQDVDQMHDQFEAKLLSILHNFAVPKPYVLETVTELKRRGIRIGSTTGYTDRMMEIVVREAAKEGYSPDLWLSPDSVNKKGRPYPYMIFQNMEKLGIQSVGRVIKVGDTVSDILEGKNAGVITVGVVEGSSEMGLTMEEYNGLSEEDKKQRTAWVAARYLEAGADYVIDDIRGILNLTACKTE